MDKQRESFLFYKDWWNTLKSQDSSVRYEVFDAIMNKVFDGQTPKVSPLAKMALSFILPVIERDCLKYMDTCEKRKKAIEKRWDKSKHENTKVNNCIQVNTNVTDNDNENENEYDNDNDNNNNVVVKEEKEENDTDNVLLSDEKWLKRMVETLIDSPMWKENVCMMFHKKPDEMDSSIREFGIHVGTQGKLPTDMQDAKSWFVSWLRKREQYLNEQKPTTPQPKVSEAEEQRQKESEARHEQFLKDKKNKADMPESLIQLADKLIKGK